MRNVNNTVDTVNAAASAIVSAESRVQPSSVQKKKCGSWWSLGCFGSQKNNKRIGHAVLVPEPVGSGSAPVAPVQNSSSNSTSIFLPFIAPPSSPASFLQSGPSSVSHTPHTGLVSLTVNAYSRNEPPSAFAIGPYAHETQPVTPPVDSAVTTAPYTPPPESGQVSCATPSSPEVPFAQLLTSSLERAKRNGGGVSHKFSAGHYEFQSHQVYPGSPGGGNLISPGSVVSNSGTSSPYPGKCSIIEFRIGEPPKFLGFEHFTVRKWGSRFGSGSITPAGQGSRLGSGALTPDGGSGGGLGSKLASGAVTPLEGSLLDSQISEVASLANSDDDNGSSRQDEAVTVAHRVSFELTGEDVARCFASKLYGVGLDDGLHEKANEDANKWSDSLSCNELSQKLRTFSLGSSKEFKFDNAKEEMIERTAEWWANEKVVGKGDNSPGNSWSFFPVLRSGGFS
ncbi:hypothetical protein N665_0043s0111 [Sinapis alba]|nr:hypothetical protein N665_0043s0111 [Sinapis alba]